MTLSHPVKLDQPALPFPLHVALKLDLLLPAVTWSGTEDRTLPVLRITVSRMLDDVYLKRFFIKGDFSKDESLASRL